MRRSIEKRRTSKSLSKKARDERKMGTDSRTEFSAMTHASATVASASYGNSQTLYNNRSGSITDFISLNKRRPIFDYKLLSKAITTRDTSYKLLMWISEAIDKGLIQPSRVAHHAGGPDAAYGWLRANYFNIPDDYRPQESDIKEFAAFFSTFLTSSFDVVENPGTTGEGPTPTSCRCEVCMRIVNAPHLRTKKLYAKDKRRAESLMRECLEKFAKENSLHLNRRLGRSNFNRTKHSAICCVHRIRALAD